MKPTPLQNSLAISLLAHGLVFGVAYAVRQATVTTPPQLLTTGLGVIEIIAAPGDESTPQPPATKPAPAEPTPQPPALKPIAIAAPVEIPPAPTAPTEPTPAPLHFAEFTEFLAACAATANSASAAASENSAGPASAATPSGSASVMARCLSNPKPPYPRAARQQRQEGMVLLALTVTEEGRVAEVQVKQSSRHRLLDEAAFTTVKQWRFAPARVGNVAVSAQVEVPVRFKLSS